MASTEEMKSTNFILSVSVTDSAGESKGSPNFNLLDDVGQPSPIGESTSLNFILEAGFIYQTIFSTPLGVLIPVVITGLGDILADSTLTLTKQDIKKVESTIKFLEDALAAWALFEAGDDAALANALNKTKSAINKLHAINDPAVDTQIFQKMLSQASELAVNSMINEKALAATGGETNLNIIQARIFFSDGSAELLNESYDIAVQSFVQAYNEALLAV